MQGIAAAAWLACICVIAQGQAPSTAIEVRIDGMGGDTSVLTLTYPTDPDADTVAQDLEALAEASGWVIASPAEPAGETGVLKTEITPAVIPEVGGGAPLFPILRAFDRFGALEVTFVGLPTGDPGDYEGENEYLAARWSRRQSVTKYSIRVKDNSFSEAADIALPDVPAADAELAPLATEAPGPSAQLPTSSRAPRSRLSTRGLWILLVLGSLGAGVFVWGLTWWLMTVRLARIGAGDKKGNGPSGSNETSPSAGPTGPGGEDDPDNHSDAAPESADAGERE